MSKDLRWRDEVSVSTRPKLVVRKIPKNWDECEKIEAKVIVQPSAPSVPFIVKLTKEQEKIAIEESDMENAINLFK